MSKPLHQQMKTPVMKITMIGLTVLLGAFGSLSAIERPAGEKVKEEVPAAPQGGIFGDEQNDQQGEMGREAALVKKIGYLGVGGQACSEALVIHLNLKGGLLLTLIDPTSPAGLVGLMRNDIIIAVDGEELMDQESLREALYGTNPGSEVVLRLIRAGKKIDQKVTLGEAPAGRELAMNPRTLVPNEAANMHDLMNQKREGSLEGLGNTRLKREMLERLEKVFGNQGGGFQQLRLDLDGNRLDGENLKMGLQGFGSVRLEDGDGSIEMKMQNGQRELKIRDKKGGLLFVGPYDSDEDKAAVPDDYRERVERLDMGNKSSFRLQLNRGGELQKLNKNSEKGE